MSVEIVEVSTNKDIEHVVKLAREIWTQHFTPIIGKAQVEYMLTNFQSPDTIKSQIINGSKYYLAKVENEYVGYAGVISDLTKNKMMLSKIYIKSSLRGKGVGQSLLDYIENKCILEGSSSLWLTVNRFNDNTISWYEHRGFMITDKVKKDIGGGFFMDDYIMEKIITPQT